MNHLYIKYNLGNFDICNLNYFSQKGNNNDKLAYNLLENEERQEFQTCKRPRNDSR